MAKLSTQKVSENSFCHHNLIVLTTSELKGKYEYTMETCKMCCGRYGSNNTGNLPADTDISAINQTSY